MRAVPIVNPKGKEVGPSIEAVNDGSYNPLSRPLFIYVRDTAAARAEVKEFIQFYLTEGAELAKRGPAVLRHRVAEQPDGADRRQADHPPQDLADDGESRGVECQERPPRLANL